MLPLAAPATPEERDAWRARVGDAEKVRRAAHALLDGDMDPIVDSLREAGIGRPSIEIDPPEASLDLPPLRALWHFWNARRGPDGAPPAATTIDAVELRGALGNLIWLETTADGLDYLYRLYGTNITTHAGTDWTGWTMGSMTLKTGGGLGVYYRALQTACALSRKPVASQHNSPPLLRATTWRRLTVPFVDEAGGCTQFLVATVPVAFRRQSAEEEAEFLRRVAPRPPD